MGQERNSTLLKAMGLSLPPKAPKVSLPPDPADIREADPLVKGMAFLKGLLGIAQDPGDPYSGGGALLNAAIPLAGAVKSFKGWHGTPHVFAPEVEVLRGGKSLTLDVRELAKAGVLPPVEAAVPALKVGAPLHPEMPDVVQKVYPLGRFRNDKIGTGEGAQVYGQGQYIADQRQVGSGYRPAWDPPSVEEMTRTLRQDIEDMALSFVHDPTLNANPITEPFTTRDTVDLLKAMGLETITPQSPLVSAVDNVFRLAQRDRAFSNDVQSAFATLQQTIRTDPAFTKDFVPRALKRLRAERPGSLYRVRVNTDPTQLLQWDRTLPDQPAKVREALRRMFPDVEEILQRPSKLFFSDHPRFQGDSYAVAHGVLGPVGTISLDTTGVPYFYRGNAAPSSLKVLPARLAGNSPEEILDDLNTLLASHPSTAAATGEDIYRAIGRVHGPIGGDTRIRDQIASDLLGKADIPGIRYLDGVSRKKGEGTYNYVISRPEIIDILKRYSILAPMAGSAGLAKLMSSHGPRTEAQAKLDKSTKK